METPVADLPEIHERPWEQLESLIKAGDGVVLLDFIDGMSPTETARAISRLSAESQGRLFELLSPEDAAEVIEDISDAQAADLIEELHPQQAAAILEELDSDHVVDLLGEMDEEDAQAILEQMKPDEALEARQFLSYPADTAGGLMISEYLSYPAEKTIGGVLQDLQDNRETYADYHVQYFYVTDPDERLLGVLRMHDLLFLPRSATLDKVMIRNPHKIPVSAKLEQLRDFFEDHDLFGAPVVDDSGLLVGVVLPESVEEARREKTVKQYLGLSGIIGGEEFRTMPLFNRAGRRLSWLSLNIVLNIIAASVIALYQDTLAAAITLAVFLPMVSDMSGCSGNQAVAVSMRELSLGLVRPNELLRVMRKEALLGVINGVALGVLLGGVALLWKGNPYLGLVVGGALAANTIVAVTLGGLLPLLLKRIKMDPALVSSPLLTTVTDMCGFFFVLSFATAVLPRLAG
ncbi:magnesium transporter [Trichloromonas sp.]|uniref:magnesium transporter n=1 Tax=Trichloromonas sp. TaxID=3069249 RepID=UPI003D81429A